MPKPLRGFLVALWQHWKVLMSGTASIIVGLAGLAFHGRTFALIFVGVGFVCVFVACFQAWNDEHNAADDARAQLATIKTDREAEVKTYPRLRPVAGSACSWVAKLFWYKENPYSGLLTNIFSIKFENDPLAEGDKSSAHGVTSRIFFYDRATNKFLFDATGRWWDSEVPPGYDQFPGKELTVNPATADSEIADFEAGQRRTLWIACKSLASRGDSTDRWSGLRYNPFQYEFTWHPHEVEITALEVTAVIRLRCPYFDGSWRED